MSRHGWGWDQAGPWSRHDFHVMAWASMVCRDTEAIGQTEIGVATWFSQFGVATHFLVSRHRGAAGVLRHYLCRDRKGSLWAEVGS